MLLSVDVSMYCPRFAVLDIEDGTPRLVFTSCNNRRKEANRSFHKRTPVGLVLAEIENKTSFALNAFKVDAAVWTMRRLGIANLDCSQQALGVIQMTLHKAGIEFPTEMTGSRMRLLLTGDSRANAGLVRKELSKLMPQMQESDWDYMIPIASGIAWLKQAALIP